jgi:hypothetical protein
MPSWLESRHERDPESGVLTRLFFRPPVTWSEKVKLQAKELKEIQFGPALRDFLFHD